MDDDVTAVDELPAVISDGLVAVAYFQSQGIDFTPNLVCQTAQMSEAGDRADYEAVGPGALLRDIDERDLLSLVVRKECAERLCLFSGFFFYLFPPRTCSSHCVK